MEARVSDAGIGESLTHGCVNAASRRPNRSIVAMTAQDSVRETPERPNVVPRPLAPA